MIKVLVIDDSAIVRQVLQKSLNKHEGIQVVGTAPDPYVARQMIAELKPDVLTLDIEMPRMDGLTFLKKLMEHYPLPVIIVSSVTTDDNQAAVKALEIGAFDVVNKPGGSITINEVVEDVAFKIFRAYKVRKGFLSRRSLSQFTSPGKPIKKSESLSSVKTTGSYIAIGSSTGGTVALEYLLSRLPANLPPILVVQHMPENYTYQFAQRLDSLCTLTVKESSPGEILQAGHVYIAKGGVHMAFQRKGTRGLILHDQGEKVSFQKPAVDVLFSSLARNAGENVLALILTGMGSDGAQGMLELKEKGALTIAQDEASSIVYGMPQAAMKLGAAQKEASLGEMPQIIVEYVMERARL